MESCVIIEDDFAAAVNLQRVLEEMGLTVLATLQNCEEVLSYEFYKNADVLISDVKLGVGSFAYQHLSNIKNLPPIIFVTSFADQELYENSNLLSPYIYLTKPVSDVTLRSAVVGALKSTRDRKRDDIKIIEGRVFVRSKGKLHSVDPQQITFVRSEGNYCYIHSIELGKLVIRGSIKKVLQILNYEQLIQVHRAYVVNKGFVESLDIAESTIVVAGEVLPVGRSYKKTVIEDL